MTIMVFFSFSQCPNGWVRIDKQLVVNSDFSLGNYGFTSEYLYKKDLATKQDELWPESTYSICKNPNNVHKNFVSCTDFSGDGNLMVVNGATETNVKIWRQQIEVKPNITYLFSTWIKSVHPSNPATLQFSVNGVNLDVPFVASTNTSLWQEFSAVWFSGSATDADISIVNQNSIASGNDFALDNISFMECGPESPLPIQLILFRAVQNENNNVKLTWTTASEMSSNYFSIERSTDCLNFKNIVTIKGTGSSSTVQDYYYIDENAIRDSVLYYRLKQSDADGRSVYSPIVTVESMKTCNHNFQIKPTIITNNKIILTVPNNETDFVFHIINTRGEVVFKQNITVDKDIRMQNINIPESIKSNIYFIMIKSSCSTFIEKAIIINN
ncbi:MAG: hypothetical protein A2X12_04410 [Bacteroidetes bacterium GWE2_29_8]|nr:MAG: hypothetical protein A2X12_04410 [Bacteroidetes bacterium GWE2_29_8]OFY18047.1 MAG: hypothetical protein A2X02_09790 [Bacteroidetes bacterium GWF2_29_10]